MKGLLIALVVLSVVGLIGSIVLIAMPKDPRLGNEATDWLRIELTKQPGQVALDPKLGKEKQKELREKFSGLAPMKLLKSTHFSRVTSRGNEPLAEVTLEVLLSCKQGELPAKILVTRTQKGEWSILEWN